MRRVGATPPPAYRGHLPFQGRLYLGFRRRGHLFCISRTFHTPIQEKPMAQAISFSCIQLPRPHLARPRRLCQPPWTQPTRKEPNHLSGGTNFKESSNPNASRSSGERGLGGEALLSEKRPLPPASPPSHHFTTAFNLMVRSAARRIFRASPMRKGKTQLRRLTQRPVPVRIMYQIVPKR